MKPIHCKLVATQVGDLIEHNTMNGNRKLFMVIANQMMFDTPWVTIASITDVTVTWPVLDRHFDCTILARLNTPNEPNTRRQK